MLGSIVEKNEYETYEMASQSQYNRRTIEGKTVGCSRCVGYCKYKEHAGFLTDDLRKKHNCLEKACFYYISKPRREKSDQSNQAEATDMILQAAETATSNYEGMRVINVVKYNDCECIVRYATVSNCYPIKEVEARLTSAFGKTIRMEKIECDFNVAAKLIF